jgi:hypothetical protein
MKDTPSKRRELTQVPYNLAVAGNTQRCKSVALYSFNLNQRRGSVLAHRTSMPRLSSLKALQSVFNEIKPIRETSQRNGLRAQFLIACW